MKKKHMCPHCGNQIKLSDDRCPTCKKPIYSTEEAFIE
jgi:predicted amidophosphoribosyltransferase